MEEESASGIMATVETIVNVGVEVCRPCMVWIDCSSSGMVVACVQTLCCTGRVDYGNAEQI